MHTGRERGLVYGARLVELEIAPDDFLAEVVFEEVKPLQHVGLFDETGAQYAIPGPVLVDGALTGGYVAHGEYILFQVALLLQENAAFFVVGKKHIPGNFLPARKFFLLTECRSARHVSILFRGFFLHVLQCLTGIAQAPGSNVVGVPVVVHVVLVLVGAGHAVYDVLLFGLRKMYALRPETGNAQQHFGAVPDEVVLFTCIAYVIVNGVGDCAVAVYLLEGDLPFVVAFLSVHGHHGVECRAAAEAEFFRVFYGFLQVAVAIHEQVARHVLIGSGQVKRKTIRLRIPVGAAAVFFAGETFGADVEPFVFAGVGLIHLENIEADTLLSGHVALYADVGLFPFGRPGVGLGLEHQVKAFFICALDGILATLEEFFFRVVERRHHSGVFIDDRFFSLFAFQVHRAARIFFFVYAQGVKVDLDAILKNRKPHTGAYLELGLFGLGSDIRLASFGFGFHLHPELLAVVGVLVHYICIDVRGYSERAGKVERLDAVADGAGFVVGDAAKAAGGNLHAATVGGLSDDMALQAAGLHI